MAVPPGLPRSLRGLAAVALIAALAGCAGGARSPASGATSAATGAGAEHTAPTADAAPQLATRRPEPVPPPDPDVEVPDPATLIGKTAGDVTALLGEPSFSRRDPPAEFWQYRDVLCVLDVFLYDDGVGGVRVAYLQFRAPDGEPKAGDACFRHLVVRAAVAAQAG